MDFCCDLPLKRCTATDVNDPKVAICGALRERVVVLSKFGINDISMILHGTDS